MTQIKTEITRSIKENAIAGVEFLSADDLKEVLCNISSKYSDSKLGYWTLWEHLSHSVSYRDIDGWATIPKLIGKAGCILFVLTEDFGVYLPDGNGLDIILRDTFGFVFYVTNAQFDYLLCFNDHDFVIGCGMAEKWITEHYGIGLDSN